MTMLTAANPLEHIGIADAGIVALLDHQLHNGNTDQMENARNDINKYLNGLINK